VHIIKACNEEKEIPKEEFDLVKNGILRLESRLQNDKIRIDSEILGVKTMANLKHGMLQELRSGIQILQSQDNQIAREATDLFSGMQ